MDEFSLFYEDIPWNGKGLFQPTKRLPKFPERGLVKKKIKSGFKAVIKLKKYINI